jgi:thioredoxin 1
MDKYPELKNKMNIKSLPTIIIYENGKEVKRIDGGVLFKINQTQTQILAK